MPHPDISPDLFKSVMSRHAASVCIVTAKDTEGAPIGLTVTSFTSLSLTPPLVLFCLGKGSKIHDQLTASSGFFVHLLGEQQQQLSSRFAGPLEQRWQGIPHTPSKHLNLPYIQTTMGGFECEKHMAIEEGDHTILIGRVIDGHINADQKPLVYWARDYHRI